MSSESSAGPGVPSDACAVPGTAAGEGAGLAPGQLGSLFIVSGPSGAGKTTIASAALRTFPDMTMSVSCTTRSPRDHEIDGVEYRFVDDPTFDAMVLRGDLAEWAEVHGHRYGTPRAPIERAVAAGHDVLLDVDVQGAAQLRHTFPSAITVFLLPPDRATMEARLRSRGTDADGVVRRRLENACREIARAAEYRHVIVNRSREEAIGEFESIVRDARRFGPSIPRRLGGMCETGLADFLRSFEAAT
jgi:guanylate kinase